MKEKLLAFLFFPVLATLIGCEPETPNEAAVTGAWIFDVIENEEGEVLKQTSAQDTMYVLEDGQFIYFIEQEDLDAEGRWKRDEEKLMYIYTRPKAGVERTYSIETLTDQKLVLEENGVYYRFNRAR